MLLHAIGLFPDRSVSYWLSRMYPVSALAVAGGQEPITYDSNLQPGWKWSSHMNSEVKLQYLFKSKYVKT
jgi:hypothetical protein